MFDKLSLKLDKVNTKVDLKMILSLVNALMGILRSLIEAKQGSATTDANTTDL